MVIWIPHHTKTLGQDFLSHHYVKMVFQECNSLDFFFGLLLWSYIIKNVFQLLGELKRLDVEVYLV